MKKKNASATIYMIFFIVIFLAFCAFAVDGTIIFTQRVKLQGAAEGAALAAASQFNSGATVASIQSAASSAFNLLKPDSLKFASITTEVNLGGQVRVTAKDIAQPYFLAFLGVTGINLEAKASAVSESRSSTANYTGINWITANAAYESDVISKNLNLNDTAILQPLGNFASASYDAISGYVIFNTIDKESDGKALSLGPGGFITIKLPVPIIDKPGNDLYIAESGAAIEGYMVFAGIDNNPDNPYVQNGNTGGGITWINISSSGTPVKLTSAQANGYDATTQLPTASQDKFYGSGSFDIGKKNLSMVKYIRIIDDNDESAFVTSDNTNYYYTQLYGEASTSTSGADIDTVKVLNHVKLQPSKNYTP